MIIFPSAFHRNLHLDPIHSFLSTCSSDVCSSLVQLLSATFIFTSSMENNAKRQKLNPEKAENECGEDKRLINFKEWMVKENIQLSEKVYISKIGSCSGYGLLAADDIETGHVLFIIPRTAVVWQENCCVKNIIASELKNLDSKSGWVPLLVALICEYLNPNSRWRAYFDISPESYNELDHPMFWNNDLLDELNGTDLKASVENDLKCMMEEYETFVQPFFKRHHNIVDFKAVTFDLYKKLTAFVMAYSFTDSSTTDCIDSDDDDEDSKNENNSALPPMMVPLADILNHVAKNNAELVFGKDSLRMVATCDIAKGGEIFNTYGKLSNADLLHMYGFAELYPSNHNDSVEIHLDNLLQEFENFGDLNKSKLKFIKSLSLLGEEPFAIGIDGVLGEEQLERTLKLLHSDEETLKEYASNDGWLSDDENSLFTAENLKNLPSAWKHLLKKTIESKLSQFKSSTTEDEKLIQSQNALENLPRRFKWALYVRYGQKKLLQTFMDILNS